jgi:hypothetical protein
MNFSLVEGSARYHTPEDSPANLDPASLQHMGATVLATAHHFAGQDLGVPRGGSLTYFTVLGELVHYPQQLAVPLAVLAAVVFVATLLYARKRGARGVGWAAVSFLGLLVVTTALGIGVWQVLRLLHPGYGSFHTGATHQRSSRLRPGPGSSCSPYSRLRSCLGQPTCSAGPHSWAACSWPPRSAGAARSRRGGISP